MYLDNLLSKYINYTMNLKSAFLLINCNGGSIMLMRAYHFNEVTNHAVTRVIFHIYFHN
jgi:hypothetical protein